jgi:hypothetical protein
MHVKHGQTSKKKLRKGYKIGSTEKRDLPRVQVKEKDGLDGRERKKSRTGYGIAI